MNFRKLLLIGLLFFSSLGGIFLFSMGEAQAAISFVGSAINSASPNADTIVTLPGGMSADDLIIVAAAVGDTVTNGLAAPTEGGYTRIGSATIYSNDVNDVNLDMYYKFHNGSDTTVTFTAVGGSNASDVAVVMVFRGVDTSSPFDTTVSTSSAINTSNANPPSHNWSGAAGVWAVAVGATGHTGGTTATYTGPTGYTTNFAYRAHNDTIDGLVGVGYKSSPSDPEDPGVFTAATIGTAADNAWAAATISLKPQPITTTLGDGTNPSNTSIGPGATATSSDAFTFITSAGTDNITSVTTTLATNTTSSISKVEITSDNGSTVYGSSTDPTTNSFSISLNPNIVASSTSVQYKIRITPKSHGGMPAPPGSTYTVTSTITAWSGSNTQLGSDATSSVVTIDNLSPNDVTGTSTTPGSNQVTVNWTNPGGDFSNVIVVRSTSTPNTGTPAEGATYNVGDTLPSGNGRVIYNLSDSSTTDTGLVNGTTYYYKIWTKDTNGNYSTPGVEVSDTPSAATITVSGTCVQWDMSTACSGDTVGIAVNGNLQAQTGANGATWSITGITQPNAGDILTVFVSSTVANNRAIAITKYASGATLPGINLIQRTLVIGGGSTAQTITNASSSAFDYSASGNNSNIFFDVSGANNDLSVDVNNSYSDERLLIRSGHTYQPNVSAQAAITSQNFYASSSATVTANGSIWRLGGNFENYGTFTANTSTIEFSGASSAINCSSCSIYNLTASSTATLTASSSLTVLNTLNAVGTLTIASSQTVTASTTLTLSGTISGSGTLKYTSATTFPTGGTVSAPVMFDMNSTAQTIPQRTFGAVTIENSGTSARTATLGTAGGQTITFGNLTIQSTGTGGTTVSGATNNPAVSLANLSITAGANNKIWTTGSGTTTVSGNFDLTNITTFTASAGNTLVMSGSGTLTSAAKTLGNVTLSGTITLAGATHTINGNLDMTGGTITPGASTITMSSTTATIIGGGATLNNLTIDPSSAGTITLNTSDLTASGTLNVATGDTLSLASNRTLIHSGATLTLPSGATISGSGRLTYQSATAFPTTGNASSTIKFDAVSNNQIISARTYGGAVEIDNSGSTSGRTVTFGTAGGQTITFQSNLTLMTTGTGGVTSTAATYSPNITLSNLSINSGSGSSNLNMGAGTWTASGNFNLTNIGTFTAPSGSTLIMSGSGTLTSNSKTLGNLTLSGTIILADATHTINGNLDMTGGTITPGASTLVMTSSTATIIGGGATLNNLTASSTGTITATSSDLIIAGTLQVATSTTFSINTGRTVTVSSTLTLSGTISGSGRLTYKSATTFPTTGTISSILRFDSTNGNQNIPVRTYSSTVEVENSGTSVRNVILGTAGSQSITFGDLTLYGTGSGGVTLTGATYNPSISLANFSITASGNSKNLTTGSSTWSASGNFNLTNIGTFTASTGNTLAMQGASKTLTTAGATFENIDFTGSTGAPVISGNLTANGNVTLVPSMTLTGVTLIMAGQNKNLVGAGNTVPNLTINGTAASTTIATSDLAVSGTLSIGADDILTIASSRTLIAQGTISLPAGGTITGVGTLKITSTSGGPGTTGTLDSDVLYDASDGNISATAFAARTYTGTVGVYASSSAARTITASSSSYAFNSGLYVYAEGSATTTFDASVNNPAITIVGDLDFLGAGSGNEEIKSGTNTWDISGSANLTGGIYTAASGNTLKMSGTGTLTTAGNTLSNLEINSAGAVTLASAVHTVNGNLTLAGSGTPVVTGSTITMTGTNSTITGGTKTLNNLTIDPTSAGTSTLSNSNLTVSGTLTIAANDALSISSGLDLTHSGAILTLNSGSSISGQGRLIYQSATTFPTAGSISSILRFDSTNNDQGMSARTYGGQVEIYNSTSSSRVVTLASGTHTLNSNLQLIADGNGNMTLDGSTNNATATISGNLTFTGTGAGSEIVNASSSNNWTVSGALNISNGTFTAPSANLYIGGNYTNTNGTLTNNSGTVVLNGTGQQTLSGTLDGSSAFNNLTITNNSGSDPEASPSVIFGATTTANTFTAITSSTKIQFNASSTYTFTNINFNGQATTTRVALRSSISTSTRWYLNVALAGTKFVSNTDAKDSDASGGDEIPAGDGSNLNSGGNTNWIFSIISPTVSSTANDVFEINGSSTTVSNINITSGGGSPGGKIASTTDIRLVIPAGFNTTWDSSVASIVCSAGDSCAKISTSGVTYESSNKIAVINALQNFTNGDWIQISGLKMAGFSAINASTTAIKLRVDGGADGVDDATDTKTKTIKGKLALQDHTSGQIANQLDADSASLTAANLFRFRIVPTGENINISTTTINLSNVSGFVSANITNAKLYADDVDVGANGTVSISGSAGTIVFNSWTATTTRNVVLSADISSIDEGDNINFSLLSSNMNAKGSTTLENVSSTGFASASSHGRSIKAKGGGGGASEGAPPSVTPQGGGGAGGGSGGEGTPPPGGAPPGGGTPGGGDGGSANAPFIYLLANLESAAGKILESAKNLLKGLLR